MKTKKAFSLVELITVIAIIGIMTGIAIVSLTPAKTAAKLDAAGREVASAIKLAQSYALQGKVAGGAVPCGFGINIIDSTNYEIFYATSGINCAEFNRIDSTKTSLKWTDASIESLEKYALKDGITFNDNIGKKVFYFTVPHSVIFGNDGKLMANELNIVLTFSGKSKIIKVKPGGAVEEGVVQ
jgi:prepilin-type N-terminal cleavage/methylation domain-containing protein